MYEIDSDSEPENEAKDSIMMKRKSENTILIPEIPELEIPFSVQDILSRITEAQLYRAREDIDMQLNYIMNNVQRIINRYTIDLNPPSGRNISVKEYNKIHRASFSEKLSSHAKAIESREKTLARILAWLEEWNATLSEMTIIDADERHHWIAQMEMLPDTFKAIENNVKILIRISASLIEEKKKQKKKIQIRGALWKSWKDRVIKRPATAHALRPDQMISDQFATNTKVSEIQDMLQELIGTSMFSKLENNAIKYISSTMMNLSKALSALNDEIKVISSQSTTMYVEETSEAEKEFSLKIIQDLIEENELLQHVLKVTEEKHEQLLRSKAGSPGYIVLPMSSTSKVPPGASPPSSMATIKASDKEDSIDSILVKQFEIIVDEAQSKGTKVSGVKWDSAIAYTAQAEMTPELTVPEKKQKMPPEDTTEEITERKPSLKKADVPQKEGTDHYRPHKKKQTKVPHVQEPGGSNLGEEKVLETKLSQYPELQALEKKRKEIKSLLEDSSIETKSQGGKGGVSSLWEQLKKAKSEYLHDKSLVSTALKVEPPTESTNKESKIEMIKLVEPVKTAQPDSEPKKVKTKGKKQQPSLGTTKSKEEKTEEKEVLDVTKQLKPQQLVKSGSRVAKETSESTRIPESPGRKSEQSILEEFQKAIMTFLKEKIDNLRKPSEKKTELKEEMLLKRAEVEKLGLIKAKMEEYFQKVAETVTKILRKYKDVKKERETGEKPMKQKKVAFTPGLHSQRSQIGAMSEISTFLSRESLDPITDYLLQMILAEIESERDVSIAQKVGKEYEEMKKRRREEYLQAGQEKIHEMSLKHQLLEERDLWKEGYEMTDKNLEDRKESLKGEKPRQKKHKQGQEEELEEYQKQKIQKQISQKEKQKLGGKEREEHEKPKQQQLEAGKQKMKEEGLLEESREKTRQVQKEMRKLELKITSEKEKQKPRKGVEDFKRQRESKAMDQKKIKEKLHQELVKMVTQTPMTLSSRTKSISKDRPLLQKEKEFHMKLKKLEPHPDGKYPTPITPPTSTQSFEPGPSDSGKPLKKHITPTPEQTESQGITLIPQQAQGITLTPQQAQDLGITLTPQQVQAQGITLTLQQAQTQGITHTPQQAQVQAHGITLSSQQAQGITLTPQQVQDLGITLTPQQVQAQGITLTPQQAQDLGITLTPQQVQAPGITLTPQQAQELGITLTPQQAQAQGITLTPQQAQDLGITLTPQQAQAQGITLTPQQAQDLGIILTPWQPQDLGITLTSKQAQDLGITLAPQQAQDLGITLAPQQVQAPGITLTPQQAQDLGITLTPQQVQAQGITLTPQQAQDLGITLTPQQVQAQGITLTPQQAQDLGITLTPQQAQAQGITLTPQQAQDLGITLTPQQAQAQGITLTPQQAQDLGITLTPQQAQAQGITLTPQQAQDLGITLAPQQVQAPGITLTPQQAQDLGITLTPQQVQAQGITLTPQQAQDLGITLTPQQAQAQGITLTPQQAQDLGITLAPQQVQAPGITLTPQQAQDLGITLTPQQAQAQGITLTPQQAQDLGITLTPQQVQAQGITLTPQQAQDLGITLTPQQIQAQGITLAPQQAQAQGITLTPQQAQDLGITLTPQQVQAQGITLTPQQAQDLGITLAPQLAQDLGITLALQQAQAQGITLTPQQAQDLGITLTPQQVQAQGITLTPQQAQDLGITLALQQAQAQGITLTPQQAQDLGITLTPQQVQAQGITLTPQQAQDLGITLTPQQVQAQGITLTPQQAQDLGITLTPQQAQAQGITLTPQQAQDLGITLAPQQVQAPGITLTPQQVQAQGITLTPQQAQDLGITLTPQQAQAQGITLTPQQAEDLGITLTPQQVQAQGITLTPQQAQDLGITLAPQQAQDLGITLALQQAQAQGITLTPQQAQAQGITLTPQQVQAQGITLTPQQVQAQGITLTPQQAQAQGITLTPQQAQAQGITLTPQQAQDLGITLTPQQVPVQGITLTPQQAQDLGITVTPQQAQAKGITLTPQQAQVLGITFPYEQTQQTSRAPFTLEQAQPFRIPMTPKYDQTLKAFVISEQTQGMQIPTIEQAQILGVPITEGQAETKVTLTPQQPQASGVTLTPEYLPVLKPPLTSVQAQSLQDRLVPEQAQALMFTLTPEKARALGITLTPDRDQAVSIALTPDQAQALGIALTEEQAWKLGVPITSEKVQEASNVITLKQLQALGITPSGLQAQALGSHFTLEQAQALGIPVTPEDAWLSAFTRTPEQTQVLPFPITLEQAQALGIPLSQEQLGKLRVPLTSDESPLTLEQVQRFSVPFTPRQAQSVGTTLMSEQDLKSRAPLTDEQPSQLWARPFSGHTPESGTFSVTDESIIPSAPQIPEQIVLSDPSTLRTVRELKVSPPTEQSITTRLSPSSGQSLAFSVPTAEKSIFGVSSTPLQVPRPPLIEAPLTPKKSPGMGVLFDPRKPLAPQIIPSSRKTLVYKDGSFPAQFLAPEIPPSSGQLSIPGAPPSPEQPLEFEAIGSRQFFTSRSSLTPRLPLISKTPPSPRQPLVARAPSTSRQIPSLWAPLSPGQPPFLGASSIPEEQLEYEPLTQATRPPGTPEQSPYLWAPSTLGQHLTPWTLPEQASTFRITPTLRYPSTLWGSTTPVKPQKELSSSVTKKRLAMISSLKSKLPLVHPSAPDTTVRQTPFTTKFQMPAVSDTTEETQILQDTFAMEPFKIFKSYFTKYRTPVSQPPCTDEEALPALIKTIRSLPSLTAQLPKSSQITPPDWDQKSRFPPIDKSWILTSVLGTKKAKMMVSPSTTPQELEEKRYFLDVEAQRQNLILLNQATKTSGLPSQLHATARTLIIETLRMDTVRLGYLFRKYIAYRLIQRARNNIIKRLKAIRNSGKGYEIQDLYKMLNRIDDYQKKVMQVWTEKLKSLEEKRNQNLRKMIPLFSQLQELHKLNLSKPTPLIIDKKQIPVSTKLAQQPFLELLVEEDRQYDIIKRFRQEDQTEAIWNAELSTSSYPITEKASIHSLWAQLGGYPDTPRLLQLDVQSTFRKSLASIQSQLKKIPK